VTAGRECSWNASADTSWLQLTPASGQGDGEITLLASANQQSTSRTATIVVNDFRVSVTQDASPCRFTLSRSEARVAANGARVNVTVSAQQDCQWSAHSGEAWVRVLKQPGAGSGDVELDAQPNTGDQRSARVTIAGQMFTVVQEKFTRPEEPRPSPTPTPSPLPRPAPQPTPHPTPTPAPQPQPPHNDDDDDGGKDKDKNGKGKDKDKDKDRDRDRG
jgi:hypothetical protein